MSGAKQNELIKFHTGAAEAVCYRNNGSFIAHSNSYPLKRRKKIPGIKSCFCSIKLSHQYYAIRIPYLLPVKRYSMLYGNIRFNRVSVLYLFSRWDVDRKLPTSAHRERRPHLMRSRKCVWI